MMTIASFQKIRVKASLFVLLLLIGTTLTLYVVTIRIMKEHILNEVLKRAESMSRSIAIVAGFSSLSKDIIAPDTFVFQNKDMNPDFEYVAIVGPNDEILVHSDMKRVGTTFVPSEGILIRRDAEGGLVKEIPTSAGRLFEITSPIVFMKNNLGFVVLVVNRSMLTAALKQAKKTIVLIFASILLVGITGSLLLSSYLTRPIQELSSGVEELKEGKRSRPLRVYAKDELGTLTESFNKMTALITAQRDQLNKYAGDLEEAYVSTVRVLAAAIDARDEYTLGHSTRVAQIAVQMGKEIGLGRNELEVLEVACLFHDVGKIKIPDDILLKKQKLAPAEREEMMRHTEYGTEILSKASSLVKYIPAVRHHHEWCDGTGYPDGLEGDKIPLQAAIMAVADVFDAMTSGRPYRDAYSVEDTVKEMKGLSGIQFRPDLMDAFFRSLEKLRLGVNNGGRGAT
jgi:putative nucleotidyltransferase with HDIG domain